MRLPLGILVSLLLVGLSRSVAAQPVADPLRVLRDGLDNALLDDTFAITELSPTVYVPQANSETRSRLDRVDQFLVSQQWSEAVEMLVRLTEYQGEGLVAASTDQEGFPRFVSVPEAIRARLSDLKGPAALSVLLPFRQRIDPLAAKQLARAIADRDEDLLRQLVREASTSSVGDNALLLLGDMCLEKGNFDAARQHWRATHASLNWVRTAARLPYWLRLRRGESPEDLRADLLRSSDASQPERKLPLADVWARLTLTSILEGRRARAEAELRLLEHFWPQAAGVLGGRQTNYQEFLHGLINGRTALPPPLADGDWWTFAGNSRRNFVGQQPIDIPTSPDWQIQLAPLPTTHPQIARQHQLPIERAGEASDFPSSCFPVVVGNLVFCYDQRGIRCLDLQTGRPAWSGQQQGLFFSQPSPAANTPFGLPTFGSQEDMRIGEQRFTLASNGDLLLATTDVAGASGGRDNSALLGFDLSREGALRFDPVELEDARWTFQGAPVCDADRCWVGLRSRDVSAQDHVASFDLRTGEQLWRTQVCSADTLGHNNIKEFANYLLTRHAGTIYCHSHLGCVAAVNAEDGRLEWLTKYPREGPRRTNLVQEAWYGLRDLTPCVVFDGMLIVAPADSPRVFALAASDGQLIWESPLGSDANQVLGVTERGQLILSGRRLWWLDAYTGQPSPSVEVNPFPAGPFSSPLGMGRGLLSGGNIYWPTAEDGMAKIYVLDQTSGRPSRQPIDLEVAHSEAGNLLLTRTHLLLTAPHQVTAFRRVPQE